MMRLQLNGAAGCSAPVARAVYFRRNADGSWSRITRFQHHMVVAKAARVPRAVEAMGVPVVRWYPAERRAASATAADTYSSDDSQLLCGSEP